MTEYACEGRIHHSEIVVTSDGRAAAAKMFKDLHGKLPDSVGDVAVYGGCDSCQQAVFLDQPAHGDTAGALTHCAPHCCECDFSTEQPMTPDP